MIESNMDGAARKQLIDQIKRSDNSKTMQLAEQLLQLGSLYGIKDTDIIAYLLYALRLEQIKVLASRKSSTAQLSQYHQDMKAGKVKPALKKNLHNEDIRGLKEMGFTNREIAERYSVSERTIRNRLKDMEKEDQQSGNAEDVWKNCL